MSPALETLSMAHVVCAAVEVMARRVVVVARGCGWLSVVVGVSDSPLTAVEVGVADWARESLV